MDGKKRITSITGTDLTSTPQIPPIQGDPGSRFDIFVGMGMVYVSGDAVTDLSN